MCQYWLKISFLSLGMWMLAAKRCVFICKALIENTEHAQMNISLDLSYHKQHAMHMTHPALSAFNHWSRRLMSWAQELL